MKHSINIILLASLFAVIVGCGESGTEEPADPNTPVLAPIGNKTVTTGDTLTFTISATDPNGLQLTYDSDSSNFYSNTRQFSWNTTGVALGDYNVQFSVMNSAGLSDSETIRIRIQAEQTPPPLDQFTTGQTLYNNNCRGSGCHKNEDANQAEGAIFGILCSDQDVIKTATEDVEDNLSGMPVFDFSEQQEAAISYYLWNVRPDDCIVPNP